MKKTDIITLCIMNGSWLLLLCEHLFLHLDLAFPLAMVWGILALLFDIRIFWKYAVTVTYEDC